MKILIDMNLPPSWVQVFRQENWEAYHWSAVGSPTAPDSEILEWATDNGCVVFTHDLDFGALLASKPRRDRVWFSFADRKRLRPAWVQWWCSRCDNSGRS